MTRTRYRIFEDSHPYFLTCTIAGWLPVFTRPDSVEIIYDSWRFLQSQGRMCLFGYVILENHLHLIAKSENLSEEVGDFKSFTARKIVDLLRENKATTICANYGGKRHTTRRIASTRSGKKAASRRRSRTRR